MNISVIICTCNRYELIIKTLESVINNTRQPFEIIIVDQSDDKERMLTLLQGLPFRNRLTIIKDEGKGLSRARNKGWQLAGGDIIAFTDDDAYVDAKWIQGILQSFELKNFRTGITGGKIIPVYYETNPEWKMPEEWEFLYPAYDRGNHIGEYKNGELPPGVSFAILKSLLAAIGGFNERLGVIEGKKIQIYGEDSEVGIKVQKLGYHLVYNPGIIVYHPVPLSRQNQDYLNRRLYTEGITQMYINLSLNKPAFRKKVFYLYDNLKRLFMLVFFQSQRHDRRVYLGIKYNIKGRIYAAAIKGILGIEI